MWILNSHRSYDTLNLGKPSKPKYATEQQDETVSIIRSSFRAEMSNFSNSIKYLGKLLNFQVFPTAIKRDCTSAHLFGFSQQSGLSARPEMKLQKCTLDCLRNMGCLRNQVLHLIMCQPSLPTTCLSIFHSCLGIVRLTVRSNTPNISRSLKGVRKIKKCNQLHRWFGLLNINFCTVSFPYPVWEYPVLVWVRQRTSAAVTGGRSSGREERVVKYYDLVRGNRHFLYSFVVF